MPSTAALYHPVSQSYPQRGAQPVSAEAGSLRALDADRNSSQQTLVERTSLSAIPLSDVVSELISTHAHDRPGSNDFRPYTPCGNRLDDGPSGRVAACH